MTKSILLIFSSASAWAIVRGKPSNRNPFFTVVLLNAVLYHAQYYVVRYQLAAVNNILGGFAEFGSFAHFRTEHITRRNMGNAIPFGNLNGLCAFPRPRRAQKINFIAILSGLGGFRFHSEIALLS